MLGALLWILVRNKGKLAELSFLRVLFLICYTLYGGLISIENVDNAAHFGGLAAGFFLAIILYRKKKRQKEKEGTL